MTHANPPTLLEAADPTLGGLIGDGRIHARNFAYQALRETNSDPMGLYDEQTTIHDKLTLSCEIEHRGNWQTIELSWRRSDYQSVWTELASVTCAGLTAEFEPLTQDTRHISHAAELDRRLETLPSLRQSFASALLRECEKHAALRDCAPAGETAQWREPGETFIQASEPSAANFVHWGSLCLYFAGLSIDTHIGYFTQPPSEALRAIYSYAEEISSAQIEGLLALGMSSQWTRRYMPPNAPELLVDKHDDDKDEDDYINPYDYDYGYEDLVKLDQLLEAQGGLMHKAVCAQSRIAAPRLELLLALQPLVDPFEPDSAGLSPWDLVKQQLNELLEGSPYCASADISPDGPVDFYTAANAIFESWDLKRTLGGAREPSSTKRPKV